ncbi:hypothetical protein DH2020_023404 [Rehmannia glutinosa]|uniref:Uncharacterized protein n=1 Tax=Rehmannia glutinosa TaxID=99300 RepID=A0ABR0W8V0_REHGL
MSTGGMKMDINHHFMDKTEPGKEITEDMTRESLIAISYGLPEHDQTAEMSPKNIDGEKVVEPQNCDGEEKYRSKLISISYSPSPDAKAVELLPEELNG